MSAPALALHGITKRFGHVVACDDVTLDLHAGNVHGVLGENGADKSTLMKILIGLVRPDAGRIVVDGRPVVINAPADAAALGIGMVHQHFSLIDALRVWENVVLGDRAKLDPAAARAQVRTLGDRYGLVVDPDARVGELPVGMRQRVEILKCLRHDPRIVILDEPTSVLTPAESRELFEVLRAVVAPERRVVVLVSHKLDEVMRATDVVSIMRQGRVVESVSTRATDAASLARAMVGRAVSLRREAAALGLIDEALQAGRAASGGSAANGGSAAHGGGPLPAGRAARAAARPVVLELRDVSVRSAGAVGLDGVSLSVGAGEIVGVAGVEGNGQVALADLLSSLVPVTGGSVRVGDEVVPAGRAGAMARAGIGVIPEDRHASGCVLEMSVAENLVLDDPQSVAYRGVLSRRRMRAKALELMHEFDIAAASPSAPMWSLSGGNQQRVVLARELSRHPKVLVAAQPTRGLDVGAIEYMGERLRATAGAGVAVLLISSELEELFALSDRVVVLSRGRIVGEFERGGIDLERLGLLMGGSAA